MTSPAAGRRKQFLANLCFTGPAAHVWAPGLFFVLLGYSLHLSGGFLNAQALILITLGYFVFAIAERNAGTPVPQNVAMPTALVRIALWAIVLFFCQEMTRNAWVHFVVSKTDQRITRGFLWGSLGLASIGFLLNLRSAYPKNHVLCWAIAACLFLARIFVLRSSPEPRIDVFTVQTEGSRYLLDGLNPYSQSYTDLYDGQYGYKPTFAYWPGVILPELSAWLLFEDIRVAFIVCDLITFVGLSRLFRKLGGTSSLSWLIALAWLSFPVSLFILEQAWTDNLIVASSVVFLLFLVEGRWSWAGVVLGYLVSVKQYAVFWGAMVFVFLAFHRQPRPVLLRTAGWAAASFSCVLLPFVFWDWGSFYGSTVRHLVDVRIRTDALTWVAALQRKVGWVVPGWMMAGASGATFLVAMGMLARAGFKNRSLGRAVDPAALTYSVVLVYGMVFLLGKQAFCNYYYLLSFFVLLHWVFALRKATPDPG